MDASNMIEEMGKMLDTVEAKVAWLMQRNQELEKENANLLRDNEILRNYVDNESVPKGALRNLLGGEYAEFKQATDWGEFAGESLS